MSWTCLWSNSFQLVPNDWDVFQLVQRNLQMESWQHMTTMVLIVFVPGAVWFVLYCFVSSRLVMVWVGVWWGGAVWGAFCVAAHLFVPVPVASILVKHVKFNGVSWPVVSNDNKKLLSISTNQSAPINVFDACWCILHMIASRVPTSHAWAWGPSGPPSKRLLWTKTCKGHVQTKTRQDCQDSQDFESHTVPSSSHAMLGKRVLCIPSYIFLFLAIACLTTRAQNRSLRDRREPPQEGNESKRNLLVGSRHGLDIFCTTSVLWTDK